MAEMTLEEALAAATVDDEIAPVNDVITIDAEAKTINVPESEQLFGVSEEQEVERKYFRCPRIVGDNIDLSTHQIYISYLTVLDETFRFEEDEKPQTYWCGDVSVDETGKYITFSWLLSENVLKNKGFIGFSVIAKKLENGILRTRWKTSPAIGTVKMSIPDANQEIINLYPDIVTQLLNRMDSVEDMTTEEAMQQRVNTYFDERRTEEYEALKNEAVTDVNNAGAEQKRLVENSGTEETSKVTDEGALQIQAVKDEGTRQKQEIEKYAGEAVDFGSQVQANTKALGGFSFSLNPDDGGLDITYTK